MSKHEIKVAYPKNHNHHGVRLSAESFSELPVQTNGDNAVRMGLEHDPHYLPLGKIARTTVEDKGDHILVTSIADDTHSLRRFHHQQTGLEMVEMNFVNDSRPFVRHSANERPSTIIAKADVSNFDSMREFEQFVAQAKNQSSHADSAGLLIRQSLTPEPLIQFFINYPELAAVLTWVALRGEKFLRYTVDETLRKVGSDIADEVSRRLRRVIRSFENERAVDDRPPTLHLVIDAKPEINLLTKNIQLEDNTDISLRSLCEQMEKYKDLLVTGDSVTFSRSAKNEDWQILYLETSSGNVMASAECYAGTMADYEMHKRGVPVCICLKHKTTKDERHYKTSALLTDIDEQGYGRIVFKRLPEDVSEWEIMSVVLELDDDSHTSG